MTRDRMSQVEKESWSRATIEIKPGSTYQGKNTLKQSSGLSTGTVLQLYSSIRQYIWEFLLEFNWCIYQIYGMVNWFNDNCAVCVRESVWVTPLEPKSHCSIRDTGVILMPMQHVFWWISGVFVWDTCGWTSIGHFGFNPTGLFRDVLLSIVIMDQLPDPPPFRIPHPIPIQMQPIP